MKSHLYALLFAAVMADETETTEAAAAPAVENMIGKYIPLGEGLPSLMFGYDNNLFMFSGKGQRRETWLGLSWAGQVNAEEVGSDFIQIRPDNDRVNVKDLFGNPNLWDAERPSTDGGDNWLVDNDVSVKSGDDWDWTVQGAPGNDRDVKFVCGTAAEGETPAVNSNLAIEWFYLGENDENKKWTDEGDLYAELNSKCEVEWWGTAVRPPVEVEAGAVALAAATTAAFAALFI